MSMLTVIPTRPEHETGSVHIGSRWRPGHILRVDTERGTFESINPPVETLSRHEVLIQRALLYRVSPSLWARIKRSMGC